MCTHKICILHAILFYVNGYSHKFCLDEIQKLILSDIAIYIIYKNIKLTGNHNILQLGIELTRLLLSHFHMNINPKGTIILWT